MYIEELRCTAIRDGAAGHQRLLPGCSHVTRGTGEGTRPRAWSKTCHHRREIAKKKTDFKWLRLWLRLTRLGGRRLRFLDALNYSPLKSDNFLANTFFLQWFWDCIVVFRAGPCYMCGSSSRGMACFQWLRQILLFPIFLLDRMGLKLGKRCCKVVRIIESKWRDVWWTWKWKNGNEVSKLLISLQ